MTQSPAPRPPLDPERLAVPAGWRVEVQEETPSTNAYVAERARAGEEPGLVLVTEHQTAGRGRLDRAWETPARSSLTFSVLLRPDVPAASWPWLPLLTGYAVQAALADRLPDIALKWPNDVLVDADSGLGRKVCGILVERVETPDGPVAVVGIGINVDQTLDELPVALATSVSLETGEPVERTGLLGQVLGSLHGLQGLLDDVGVAAPGVRRRVRDARTHRRRPPAGGRRTPRRGARHRRDRGPGRRHRRRHVHGRRGRRRARPSRLAAGDTG